MRHFRIALLAAVSISGLSASSIFVANSSFETLAAGFPMATCGGVCGYNWGPNAIPGWITDNGSSTGALIMGGYNGNPGATDGNVMAWSNGGFLMQTTGTAVAGVTYTLQVDLLHRIDAAMAGIVQLEVNGTPVATATGTDLGPGTWSTWTTTYTATALDNGNNLTILLSAGSTQGDFDNVRLNDSTSDAPEPASFAFLGLGLTGIATLRRRRA
jgi:hypothetical protein